MKPAHCWLAALALALGSGADARAEGFSIGGTGAALGSMRLLARAFQARNPDVALTVVPGLTSSGGIKAATEGVLGLGVSSRPLRDDERKLGAREIEYARTPFVFAVSARSNVTAITSAELADIYAGKTVSWPDGSPVRIVLRPPADIDTEIIMAMSAALRRGLLAAQARPGVRVAVTDRDAADDLTSIGGSIGPSSLSLIQSEKLPLRVLRLDGREATPANAAGGSYPYFKRLFLVTGAKRTAAVERFIAFVQSPAGRKILTSEGQWIP